MLFSIPKRLSAEVKTNSFSQQTIEMRAESENSFNRFRDKETTERWEQNNSRKTNTERKKRAKKYMTFKFFFRLVFKCYIYLKSKIRMKWNKMKVLENILFTKCFCRCDCWTGGALTRSAFCAEYVHKIQNIQQFCTDEETAHPGLEDRHERIQMLAHITQDWGFHYSMPFGYAWVLTQT